MNNKLYLARHINSLATHGYSWDAFPQKVRKALKCYHQKLYKVDLSHLEIEEWSKEIQEHIVREFFINQ